MTKQTDVNDLLRRVLEVAESHLSFFSAHSTFKEAHAYLNSLEQGPDPELKASGEVHTITLKPEMFYDGSVLASRLDSLEATRFVHSEVQIDHEARLERIEKVLQDLMPLALHGAMNSPERDQLLRALAHPSNKEASDD